MILRACAFVFDKESGIQIDVSIALNEKFPEWYDAGAIRSLLAKVKIEAGS